MGMTSVRGEHVQAQLQLDALQSITDVILAHLGSEDLLHELLLRIRQILRVDSSVILLKKGDMLETRSAVRLVGLEEEVERGVPHSDRAGVRRSDRGHRSADDH